MTQKEKIIAMLKTAGPAGLNSFGVGRQIALQLPVRIKELKQAGYLITTRKHKNKSVDYILISEPAGLKREKPKPPVRAFTWGFDEETKTAKKIYPEQEALF